MRGVRRLLPSLAPHHLTAVARPGPSWSGRRAGRTPAGAHPRAPDTTPRPYRSASEQLI